MFRRISSNFLHYMYGFWAQVFLLPKKVLWLVEKLVEISVGQVTMPPQGLLFLLGKICVFLNGLWFQFG